MSSRSARFTVLLFWNGLAFIASLISGFVLSPLVVKGLGIEAYGVWALVFSLLDYLAIADLGIRSATVKYVAQYESMGDRPRLFKTLNASLLYFFLIAALVTAVVLLGAGPSLAYFRIPARLNSDYILLLRLTGVTMAFQLMFNVAKAALEGIQDFPAISRINIATSALRTTLCLLALHFRLGLGGLGWATVGAMWCGFLMLALTFRSRFPDFRVSMRDFDTIIFRQMLRYGLPTLFGSLASQFLQNGPVVLLGILKDAASVGYYSLVLRLLASLYELISQAGNITTSVTARLAAEDDRTAMERTVLYLNRYSFALFSFVFVFLIVFGKTLFTLWVGPAVAANCLPLVPWLAFGYAFGAAAHQHSIATLFGMAEHAWYNYGLGVESVVLLGGWMLFVPGRPLSFAAAWWGISFFLSRGLRPTWTVSRALRISFPKLLAGIYLRPLGAALLTTAVMLGLRFVAPPGNWRTLFGVAIAGGILHLGFCAALVLAPEHRRLLTNLRSMQPAG